MLGNTEGRAANKTLFTFAPVHRCQAFICHSEKWANVAQKSDDCLADFAASIDYRRLFDEMAVETNYDAVQRHGCHVP